MTVSWHFDRSLGRKAAKRSAEKQRQNIYHFQQHVYAEFNYANSLRYKGLM